jgi:hypothetical protein
MVMWNPVEKLTGTMLCSNAMWIEVLEEGGGLLPGTF